MIEAVSSTLVSAQILRGNVGGRSAPVTTSPAPEAPKAPYISPYISIDVVHNKAVIQIRDRDTGDVQDQFPTASRLAQLSQAQVRLEQSQSVKSANIPDTPPRQNAEFVVPPPAPFSAVQSSDIITVQDATSNASANVSLPSPQVVSAALTAGAQAAPPPTPTPSPEVSVLA
ncbi:MAG: hypothetical protein COA45_09800 [Zetaproteobacteria bacterium]|nr:MAG: hypothetical protein COA45_09800 [Zetaproteobacteria bacterium]